MGWRPLVSVWLFISTVCTVLCHPAESVCPSDTILWCHQPLPTLSSSLCTSRHDPKHHTLRSRLQVVFGMGEPGSRGGIFSWHAQALKKIICATKRFSIIYLLSYNCVGNWQIGAPACWEGAVHRSCVRSGKGRSRGGRGRGQFTSPKWSGQGVGST